MDKVELRGAHKAHLYGGKQTLSRLLPPSFVDWRRLPDILIWSFSMS